MNTIPSPTLPSRREGGYILLLSVLVSSIILAIALGVYAISLKEVILASYLKDSARAFATADRAMECALYWDRSYPQNGMPYSIYPTSTEYLAPWVLDPGLYDQSMVRCDGQEITRIGPADTDWTESTTAATGVAGFRLMYPNGTCAEIEVRKSVSGGTVFTSDGYNTCDEENPRQINRTIQVTSNI
jgi:type II secretory pathway pseudopilin PulG